MFTIKNWPEFQHFKDRNPPWIKVYKKLLDDPEWFALSGPDAKLLVMLWLLASEDVSQKGQLPPLDKISFRLRLSEEKILQALQRLTHWVRHDDITLISSRYHVDAPETETESSSSKKILETYKAETKTDGRIDIKVNRSPHLITDEEFLSTLKTEPCYQGIDILSEWGKCGVWCEHNHRQRTHRRFVNWLNRIEHPSIIRIARPFNPEEWSIQPDEPAKGAQA